MGYLLSPEGKTVFYIPGVEVVHKVSTPINLPEESNKIKMEPGKMQPPPGGSRKRAAGLSLDLNSASAKRNKQVQSLLTSPDVQMLKLTSPELEKFLIQNPTLATPTPSGYIFPKSVTEEQAMYAKGFEEALEHLRQSEPPGSNDLAAANTLATLSTASVGPAGRNLEVHRTLPESHRSLDMHKSLPEAQQNQGIPLSVQASSHSRPASGASGSYDSETYQVPDGVKIKDEPDDHLSLSGSDYGSEGMKSPPMNTTGMSPIDMETQEKIKLDRKRQRNRLAASKCRKKAGADFSAGRPSVGVEKRERRPGRRGEEDEGRGGLAEAGGDRARQLWVRHQGRRGGKLLTRASCCRLPQEITKMPS